MRNPVLTESLAHAELSGEQNRYLATGCYIPHGVVPNPGAWLGLPNTETLNMAAHTINEVLKVGPLMAAAS